MCGMDVNVLTLVLYIMSFILVDVVRSSQSYVDYDLWVQRSSIYLIFDNGFQKSNNIKEKFIDKLKSIKSNIKYYVMIGKRFGIIFKNLK